MKKILFRKLFVVCFIFFLISLLGATTIVWIFQAVNFLDIMIEDGRSYMVYFNYTILNFPKIISKLIPFALFFSFFYTVYRYEIKNELIIFWIHGVEKIELFKFFLKLSILLTLLQLSFTNLIVPYTQEYSRELIRSLNVNLFENFVKPKKFIDSIKNLTIFTDERTDDGIYKNLYLKKKEGSNYQITFAKEGVFKNINGTNILILYDGQTINKSENNVTHFNFSQSDLNLAEYNTNTITINKTQEQTTFFLIKCVNQFFKKEKLDDQNCRENNLKNIYKEIFKRFIIPLFIPGLILISLISINKSKEDISYRKNLYLSFFVGILIIIISESMLKLIDKNFLKNIFISSIPILVFFTLYIYVLYQTKIKFNKLIK